MKYQEKEILNRHEDKIPKDLSLEMGSPQDREILSQLGYVLSLEGRMYDAEKCYCKAGQYEWEYAANRFEELGEEAIAKRFWNRLGKHPTGYSDEMSWNSAMWYEKAGNTPEAIKSYKKAIEAAICNDGWLDMHGDEKVGKEMIPHYEEKIRELEELLKS
ncbi:MAG: hypothetical protein OEL87_00460 [Nanoarchaeota archaeon]|nr:hypothetical protein [Nanoarchaeota archaeon]